MSVHFLLVVVVVGMVVASVASASPRSLTVQGMTVQWHREGDRLAVMLYAPTRGWLAVGFNTQDQLAGTHLVMGAVVDGVATVDDRYILKPGEHKSMKELGGTYAPDHVFGIENESGTTLSFTLPLHSADRWHCALEEGKEYVLLLAYSWEDDFQHHSHMRTSVRITL